MAEQSQRPHQMREGTTYLVKERKPMLGYKLFTMLLDDGMPGLCITRQFPDRVKEAHKVEKARIIWLSQTPGEGHHNPTAIGPLATLIARYVEGQKESAVIFDGLEYLMVNNGFAQILKFVEHVNELVMRSKTIMIIPLSADAFDKKEMALLERNMEVIESPLVQIGRSGPKEDLARLLEDY
jgi:hypothetical protein